MPAYALAVATLMWIATSAVAADTGQTTNALQTAAPESIINGIPIETGFVIVKGEYVPPPYVVGTREDELFLNGQPIDTERLQMRRWGRGFGWGWREPGAGRPAAPGPNVQMEPPRPSRSFFNHAAHLERQLLDDNVLIVFGDGMATFLRGGSDLSVLKTLTGDQPREAKIQALMKVRTERINSARWVELVDSFQPSAELTRRVAELDKARTSVRYTPAAQSQKLSNFVMYGISVIGIVLGALALGTLLIHRPHSQAAWREIDTSGDSISLVIRNVVLVAVLSFFDLGCTVLSQSSIGFAEMNPLGSHLLSSPVHLVAFKVTSLLLGCGILLSLRRYRGAQVASWWLCLVCTILTFRWATYTSLFLA